MIDSIKKDCAAAWEKRKYWQALNLIVELFLAALQKYPRLPIKPMPNDDAKRWEAGREGERRVDDFLKDKLDDSWVLIAGYKNPRGEIDRILIGPGGIFSIEIKNVNGKINCYGDRWWLDKYDKYGNLVERETPIQDKKGRTPSRQLNEATDFLARFITRTFTEYRIYRIVIFTHDSSELNDLQRITVNNIVTLNTWDIDDMLRESNLNLSTQDLKHVIKMIEEDHRYHQNRHPDGSSK